MSAPTKRWPMKPPKDARCDAHVSVEANPGFGPPRPRRCQNMADETVLFTYGVIREGWFCQDCIPALLTKGTIVRNPKKFPLSPPSENEQ